MSFLDIKDPEERDATIKDYLALKKRLKDRNLQERGDLMDRRRDLEENFAPVVMSNKKMVKDIVGELTPITKELRELNNKAQRQKQLASASSTAGVKRDIDSQPRSKQRRVYGPLTDKFLEKYMDPKKFEIDTTFGIRYENGVWMIGNKTVKIKGDDIIMGDGEVYDGTPGLWSLITDKIPKEYDNEDLERYKELLHETSAMHQHYDPRSRYPRASRSKKWLHILRPIWTEFQMTGVVSDDENDETDSLYGPRVDENDISTGDREENNEKDGLMGDDYSSSNGNDDNETYHDASTEFFNESEEKKDGGDGIKMYLQKNGRCFGLQRSGGKGIKFTPRPRLAGVRGNGLYLRIGSSIYAGEGLLLGPQSPFRKIPILGWIL